MPRKSSRQAEKRVRKLLSVIFCLIAGLILSFYGFDQKLQLPMPPVADDPAFSSASIDLPVIEDRIRIASFNIQVFGQSKLNKARVMRVLARLVQQFDVVAVQEIRSEAQDVIPRFLKIVNHDGANYDYVISERLGRTVSKEQYAFLFNADRIAVDRRSATTLHQFQSRLHRPPFVAKFRTLVSTSNAPFTFTLVNLHTDPDETRKELNALDDVIDYVREADPHEDDVLLLGDLNVDRKHFGELGQIPHLKSVPENQTTNMRRTEQYDHITFDALSTTEFTGRAEVYDLPRRFGMTLEEAIEVSDHLPIWAEFDVDEHQFNKSIARPDDPLKL
ncbi:MAG: endonuclease/exonuclease/phosphatase family protein [Planctomycetota bacterium]|nr:endonuclease/exonuclease/phosphatase family protein [Planctomycetota bacterium]MDA1214546.1 endonuclease/exonuclease/phosphatase family protein [Planctomycetota bacterium]